MFKDFLVSTPNEKGKITTQTRKTQAGKTVYILYEIGRTYNAAKKYNVPHRVVIGKADPNDPEKMYPNEKYFEHFPQTVDKVEPTEENSLRSCALEIGSFIVIDKIIKHYKLDKIASDWFGKDTGLFLDLAAYMIVTEDNVGQYYPGYAFNHPLFTEGMRLVSDSKVSRFLSSVTKVISLKYANGLRNGANSDTHRCKQLTEHGEERCIKLREVAGFSAVRTIFQIVGPRKILHCLLGK